MRFTCLLTYFRDQSSSSIICIPQLVERKRSEVCDKARAVVFPENPQGIVDDAGFSGYFAIFLVVFVGVLSIDKDHFANRDR